MGYITQKEINFGKVRKGEKKEFRFSFLENAPKVLRVTVGCKECLSYKLYNEHKELQVTYKAGPFPIHLGPGVSAVPLHKTVTVVYEDNVVDVIVLTGTKIK